MKLTMDHRKTLIDELVERFDEDTLEHMLSTRLNRRLRDVTGTDDGLQTAVLRLVSRAEEEGWVWSLIREAAAARPAAPKLAALHAETAPLAPVAGVDHFQACLLPGNQAMIDRTVLRNMVTDLQHDPTSARVLLVNGPDKCGKSHSGQYIVHLEKQLANFHVVRIDLRQRQPEALGPADVARDIVDQMGLDAARIPHKGNEQDARWAQLFWNWITGELRRKPTESWYFVIDSFSQVLLPPGTAELVEELALRIQQQLTTHSLILISYPDQERLEDMGVSVAREDIGTIGAPDLIHFFQKVFEERRRQKNVGYTAADVAAAVERVVNDVPASDPKWLRRLGASAANEAKEVMRSGGAQ